MINYQSCQSDDNNNRKLDCGVRESVSDRLQGERRRGWDSNFVSDEDDDQSIHTNDRDERQFDRRPHAGRLEGCKFEYPRPYQRDLRDLLKRRRRGNNSEPVSASQREINRIVRRNLPRSGNGKDLIEDDESYEDMLRTFMDRFSSFSPATIQPPQDQWRGDVHRQHGYNFCGRFQRNFNHRRNFYKWESHSDYFSSDLHGSDVAGYRFPIASLDKYQSEPPNQFESLQQLNQEPQECLPLFQPPEPIGNTSSETMYRERGSWRHYHHNFNREGDGRPSRRRRSHLDDIYLPNYEDNDDLIEIDVVESRYSDRYRDRNKFNRWSNYSPHRNESERKRCFKVISPENARGRGRPLANKENTTSKKVGEGDNKNKSDNSKTQSNKTKAAQCKTVVNNNSIKDTKCSTSGECDSDKDIRDKTCVNSVEIKHVNKKSEDANKEKGNKSDVKQLKDVSGNIPKTETLKLNKIETDNKYSEHENQVGANSNTTNEHKEVNESNSEKNNKLMNSVSADTNFDNTVSECHDMIQNDKLNRENLDPMDVDSVSRDGVGSDSENILETPKQASASVPKSPTGINSPNKTSDKFNRENLDPMDVDSVSRDGVGSLHLDVLQPSKCHILTTPDQELASQGDENETELCHPLPAKFPLWEQLPEESWSQNPSTPVAEIDSDQETVLFDDFISIDKIDTTKSYLDNLDPAMDDYRVVDMVIGTPSVSPVKRKNDVENDGEEVLSKRKRYDHLYSEINSDLLLTQINEVLKEDKEKNETRKSRGIKLHRSKSLTMENRCEEKQILTKSKSLNCINPKSNQITFDFDLKTNLLLLLGNPSMPKMEVDYIDGFDNILKVLKETRAEAAKTTAPNVAPSQSSILGQCPSRDSFGNISNIPEKTKIDEAKITEVVTTSTESAVISNEYKDGLNLIVNVLKETKTNKAIVTIAETTSSQSPITSNQGTSLNSFDNVTNILKETKNDKAKTTEAEIPSSQGPIISGQGTSNNSFDTVVNLVKETETDKPKVSPLGATSTQNQSILDQNTCDFLNEGLKTCDNKVPIDSRQKCDKDNACHKNQSSNVSTENTAKKESAPHDNHPREKSNVSTVEQNNSIKPQNYSNSTNIQNKTVDKVSNSNECREKEGTVEEKKRPVENAPSNRCEMTLGDYKKTVDISKKSRPPKINLHIDVDNKLKTKRKTYSDTSEMLLKKMHELFGNDNDFPLTNSEDVDKIRCDESEERPKKRRGETDRVSNRNEPQSKKAFEPNRKSLDKNRRNSSIEVTTKNKYEDSGSNKRDRNIDNKNRRNSAHESSSNRDNSYSSKSVDEKNRNRCDTHTSKKGNDNRSEKPKDLEYNKNTHSDDKKRRMSLPVPSAAENCPSKSTHQNGKKCETGSASRNAPNKLKDSNLNKCSSNNTNSSRIKRIDKNRRPSVPVSFARGSQIVAVPEDKTLKISTCHNDSILHQNESTTAESKRKLDDSKDNYNRTTNVATSKNEQKNIGEREPKEIESKTTPKKSNENKRRISLDEKITQQRSLTEQKEKQNKAREKNKSPIKNITEENTEELRKSSKENNTLSITNENNASPTKNSVNEMHNMHQERNTLHKEKEQEKDENFSQIKAKKAELDGITISGSETLFQNLIRLQPQLILQKIDIENPTGTCTNALVAEIRNSVLKNTVIPIINSVSDINYERCSVLHQERFPMRQKGRYSIVENDCCDEAVTLDPPDIRNDINIVKQIIPAPPSIDTKQSQKESDDIIEIKPDIPVIDLTDDGNDVKVEEVTSPSKVDVTILKEKQEDLTVGDAGNVNDETITLYRSDETLNNSLEVQALVASISPKVLSNKLVSSKQSDDTSIELLNKNITAETTQTLSESRTEDKIVSQLEINTSSAVGNKSDTSSVVPTTVSGSEREKSNDTSITRLNVNSATLVNQAITACFENTSQNKSLDPAHLLVEKAISEAVKQRKLELANYGQQNKAQPVCTTETFYPPNSANDQPRLNVQRVHSTGTFIPSIQSLPRTEISRSTAITATVTAGRVCNNNTLMQPPPAYDTVTNNLTKQRLSNAKYVESISFMRNDNDEHTPLMVPPSLRRAEDNSTHPVSNSVAQSPRRVDSDAGEHSFFPSVPFPRRTEDNINQTACGLIAQNSADSFRTQQTDNITEQTRSFVTAPNLRRVENSAAQIRLNSVVQSPSRPETSAHEQSCSVAIHHYTREGNGQILTNLINQSPRRNETNPLNHLNKMVNGPPAMHEINNREVIDVTEILLKYLCFFNGLKRAGNAYTKELSKLKTSRYPIPQVDATLKQFMIENSTKFYKLSKELIGDLHKLNLTRVTANFQRVHAIIENICEVMKIVSPLSLTSIYLMLEVLIQPESIHYISVPFLKALHDVVVYVTNRIRCSSAVQRQAEAGNSIPSKDPLTPQQRMLLERQILLFREIQDNQEKLIAYEQDLQKRIARAQQQLQTPSTVQSHSTSTNTLQGELQNLFPSWPITNPETGKANHTSSTLETVDLTGNRGPTSQTNVGKPPMVNNLVTSQATNFDFTLRNTPKLKSLLCEDANKASTKVAKRSYPNSVCPSRGPLIFQPSKKSRVETTNSNLTVHSNVLINTSSGCAATDISSSTKQNFQNQKEAQKADLKQSADAFKIRLPLSVPYDVISSCTSTTTVATQNLYCSVSPAARRAVQNSPFRSPLQNYIETFSVPLLGDSVAQITLPNQAATNESSARSPVYAPIAAITAITDSLETAEQPVTQTNTTRQINATHELPSTSNETEASREERDTANSTLSTSHASELTPSTSAVRAEASVLQLVKDENESQMETIDLTWMDDIDPEQIQHEIEFIAIKKEEPEDVKEQIEEDVVNHDPFAVAPSPADSGIASPSVQVEYNEQVFSDRTCICGKAAEYICGCMMAMYCSEPCQLKDWKTHKELCLKYNAKNSNKDVAQNQSPEEDVNKNKKK